MGLDIYIDKCKNPIINKYGRKDYEIREDACYWRKFYGLLELMQYGESEYGQDVRLRKEDVEKILDYVSHNRDYFDSFKTVPDVCELLDDWESLEEDGYTVCFHADW